MATLTADVTADAGSWNVSAMPLGDYLQVDDEIVRILDKRTTENRIRVQRGYSGTTAATHSSGAELVTAWVPGSGGSGEQTIYRASLTLTNAQIKALPTTAIQVVAAQPGAFLFPVASVWIANLTTGYTNVGTFQASVNVGAAPFMYYFEGGGGGGLLAGPLTDAIFVFLPAQTFTPPDDFNTFANVITGTTIGEAISVGGNNGGSGDLTGGNAANSIKATVWYGLFEV